MPKGVRDLRQIEIGFQTPLPPGADWDDCVPPTARVVGTCGMKKTIDRVFPTEATGLMSDHIIGRYYDKSVMAQFPISTGDEGLTFEQFPWFLNMGVVGLATSTGGIWTFTPALTAADMPYPATIRYGDNAGSWESCCCFASQLVISAAFQGPWNLEATIIGRDMDEQDLVGDIPYPTPLETILGQMTVLNTYADCTFTGPVPVEGSLIDWTVTIPGFHAKFFQDGHLYYSIMGLASRHLTFEATVEWDSAWAAVEHVNWAASHMDAVPSAPRYMELVAAGGAPPVGPPVAKSASIRMVLMYESFDTLDQRDGNDTVKFVARTAYDVNPAAGCIPEWEIEVGNAVDALP